MNRLPVILALALLALIGAQPRAQAKACAPEKLASGVFALDTASSAPADAAASPDFAGETELPSYEPASGLRKWLNEDPIGERGGLNLYGYVGNGPLMRVDPLGLDAALPPGWHGFGSPYDPSSNPFAGPPPAPPSIDDVQTCLDGAGLIPGYGEFADLLNTLISAGRGNWTDAGFSAASMIPFAGTAATAAKQARKQVFKHFPTRKAAKDAAATCPVGPWQKKGKTMGPEKHEIGDPHYHDGNHDNLTKPNVHYGFPDSQF